ncbi:MAG: bifunctional lysylphosphatidylglycerol flippase/synthetase MprF [Acidimicrobiales bacterium]
MSDLVAAPPSTRRHRSRRSAGAAVVAFAGLVDVVGALRPPLHGRLHLVDLVVPLVVSQAAAALVVLAGFGLLVLARGVQRGQRQAWAVALCLLVGSTALHLVKGADIGGSIVSLGVLGMLVASHQSFRTAVDRPSRRRGLFALLFGGFATVSVATITIEVMARLDNDGPTPPVGRTALAVGQRLIGLRTVALPAQLGASLDPGLLAIGIVLILAASRLVQRPVVDRRGAAAVASLLRARAVVGRHGSGSLDYFALRRDKQHFFHRETLVTYAVHGGVCLVSPDPIGPARERGEAWASFREFADRNGWKVAALGTGEEWLRFYERAGMRHLYVGDEAVVDLAAFHLAGGKRKSLRQAVNRIANHGYTVSFHDPAALEPGLAHELEAILAAGRRGSCERGFSMTLGRVFDPDDEGLLVAVAHAPDGAAAAFCQFVPAPGIGGYSLDLTRRDGLDHPNGLVDFIVVSTIDHLRDQGMTGLALNFAVMRSIVAGEDRSLAARAQRLVLRRLSASMQIESLWRYCVKYDPQWVARHVVYERLADLAPIALAVARAESFVDLPVLGRLVVGSAGQQWRGGIWRRPLTVRSHPAEA